MSTYEIYAGEAFIATESSLVAACGRARESARHNAGVEYTVERNGETVATYEQRGGQLEAWVR